MITPLVPALKLPQKRPASEMSANDDSFPQHQLLRRDSTETNDDGDNEPILSTEEIEKFRMNYLAKVKQMRDLQLFKRTNGLLSYSSKLSTAPSSMTSTHFGSGTTTTTSSQAMSNRAHERFFAPNKQKSYLMQKTTPKAKDNLGPRVCLLLQPWLEVIS